MGHLINTIRGFLMGSADVVPGVSGGTVALVLGIYERLVSSIRNGSVALGQLARGRARDAAQSLRRVDWPFLLTLLTGIAVAIISLASVIDHLLETRPRETAAGFFGLVAGSILLARPLVAKWDGARLATALAVAIIAFVLLGIRGDAVTDPAPLLFLGAGAIAVIAMILPGISGSFLLLMLGMYQVTLDAINDRAVGDLGMFTIGAVIGLALFSSLLFRLLRDHHDTTLAGLIGLMIGSLRVLWPWPDGTDSARLAAPESWGGPLLWAVAGAATVLAIGWVAGRSQDPSPRAQDLRPGT